VGSPACHCPVTWVATWKQIYAIVYSTPGRKLVLVYAYAEIESKRTLNCAPLMKNVILKLDFQKLDVRSNMSIHIINVGNPEKLLRMERGKVDVVYFEFKVINRGQKALTHTELHCSQCCTTTHTLQTLYATLFHTSNLRILH
jgi:hypothetical protein